jgi:hypothetical protein
VRREVARREGGTEATRPGQARSLTKVKPPPSSLQPADGPASQPASSQAHINDCKATSIHPTQPQPKPVGYSNSNHPLMPLPCPPSTLPTTSASAYKAQRLPSLTSPHLTSPRLAAPPASLDLRPLSLPLPLLPFLLQLLSPRPLPLHQTARPLRIAPGRFVVVVIGAQAVDFADDRNTTCISTGPDLCCCSPPSPPRGTDRIGTEARRERFKSKQSSSRGELDVFCPKRRGYGKHPSRPRDRGSSKHRHGRHGLHHGRGSGQPPPAE